MTPTWNPQFEDGNPSKICPFAKHQGELWSDVIEEDRDYVEWLTKQDWLSDELHKYLIELLEGDSDE